MGNDIKCLSCKSTASKHQVTENDGDCPICNTELIEGVCEVACCGCGEKYGHPNHDGDGKFYCGGQFCCP